MGDSSERWHVYGDLDGEGGEWECPGIETDGGESVVVVGGDASDDLAGIRGATPEIRKSRARLIAAAPDLVEAAKDALSGWRYIRSQHGDLYGVGWDRVEAALSAALSKAGV